MPWWYAGFRGLTQSLAIPSELANIRGPEERYSFTHINKDWYLPFLIIKSKFIPSNPN